jgi:hypothetical protein
MLNENVKTVLKYLADLGEEVDRSLSDGFQKKDILNFLDELFTTPAAVSAFPPGLKAIKAGFSDEDRAGYIAFIAAEFDIQNEVAEKRIEGAAKLGIAIEEFVSLFKKPAA